MINSKIEWTDHTFNPWIGCTKVSPGCLNCYAEALDVRWNKGAHWGKGAARRKTSDQYGKDLLNLERSQREIEDMPELDYDHMPPRPKIFCCSMADWLDPEVPIEWFAGLLSLIDATPHLIWQLLTKRPDLFKDRMREVRAAFPEVRLPIFTWGESEVYIPGNVWFGVSCEDQDRWNYRVPYCLESRAPIHWVSAEPLLGAIRFDQPPPLMRIPNLGMAARIDWIVVGGESGPHCRKMSEDWAFEIICQCWEQNISVFMKQLGGRRDHRGKMTDFPDRLRIRRFPAFRGIIQ